MIMSIEEFKKQLKDAIRAPQNVMNGVDLYYDIDLKKIDSGSPLAPTENVVLFSHYDYWDDFCGDDADNSITEDDEKEFAEMVECIVDVWGDYLYDKFVEKMREHYEEQE